MKYIRTKDGRIMKIYSRQKRPNGEYDTWYKGNGASLLYNHDHNVIEKEADTIKELCDEFVFIGYKIKYPFLFSKEGISIDDFWKHSPSDTIVYGAIWTDKGLIYVAKMNEKGELELL